MKIVLQLLLTLMTVLLSCCLNNLQGKEIDDSIPLRAEIKDTTCFDTLVTVSISDIRSANIKMLERKMYKEIVEQQDTIISFKDSYILEQERIIKDFQDRITKANDINDKLSKNLERQKTITYVVGGVASAALLTTVILIIAR